MYIFGIVKIVRPKQWIKNLFVFSPLIFSGEFLYLDSTLKSIEAFLFFVIASSATYVLNDIRDIDSDKKHPVKSLNRPLANGELTLSYAYILLFSLYSALILCIYINLSVGIVITCYLGLNYLYSFWLKHKPVLDIFTIAFGFVLRVYAGAVALDVPVSSWMFITTLSLTLYLATVKRRQELLSSGSQSRKVLQFYTLPLIERYAEMAATCAIMFYSIFVMSERPEMVSTIPLVLFGLFRYWFVVDAMNGGESPTDILISDKPLILTIISWITLCAYHIV